jgi:hypothetical protein
MLSGSVLDMDVVLRNPLRQPVTRVRSWLSYDPLLLEGVAVDLAPAFTVPSPGERDFNSTQGYVQIGASTEKGHEPVDPLIVVAHVRMKARTFSDGTNTVLSFYDVKPGNDAHSAVIITDLGQEKNILSQQLGSLIVPLKKTASVMSAASSAGAAASTAAAVSNVSSAAVSSAASSSAAAQPPVRTSFVLLQVQNVRVTTEGSSILLAWDPLASADLQGYNVYYGTEMGRYIQRKSVPGTSNSVVLRALPLDVTYYLAVRAVSKTDEESAFSQEVSVKVGDPKTSTSPLRGSIGSIQGPQGKNPLPGAATGSVPGETGLPTNILAFAILSAIAGVGFAFRRQLIASRTRP